MKEQEKEKYRKTKKENGFRNLVKKISGRRRNRNDFL
jgi:hypothetical protein